MCSDEQILFDYEAVKNILVQAVTEKIKHTKPELKVTCSTLLKSEAELDVFDFGDILVQLYNNTQWTLTYEVLIYWYAKNDCSIKELAGEIEYLKTHYPAT